MNSDHSLPDNARGQRPPVVTMLLNPGLIPEIFSEDALERLRSFAGVRFPDPARSLRDQAPDILSGASGAVLSWGSPRLDAPLLEHASDLRIVTYAAGSVKPVVTPALFDRGVLVTSSSAAIAEEVSCCALGLIIYGLKGIERARRNTSRGGWASEFRGGDVAHSTVGIAGAGHVGRRVIALLKHLPGPIRILVYDPRLTELAAMALGAESVSLETLLSETNVVSLHVPSLPSTRHMLNRENLPLLKDGATLINTARGAIIDPQALADELKRRPDLQAFIDVTDPEEPPGPEHPFRGLPNLALTPHLAGCVGPGRKRMGDLAVEELYRCLVTGQRPEHAVTLEMLEYLA